jgi:hypothetical protein
MQHYGTWDFGKWTCIPYEKYLSDEIFFFRVYLKVFLWLFLKIFFIYKYIKIIFFYFLKIIFDMYQNI